MWRELLDKSIGLALNRTVKVIFTVFILSNIYKIEENFDMRLQLQDGIQGKI